MGTTTMSAPMVLSQGSFLRTDSESFLQAAAAADFAAVDLWMAAIGSWKASRIEAEADALGIRIDSLCRGGDAVFSASAFDDSRRAIDTAAQLGARVLVVTAGPDRDATADAPARTTEALARLVPHAAQADVILALEPFHPMFIGERSFVVTLRAANDIIAPLDPAWVQLAIDAYHLWWDVELDSQLDRASGRIAAVHVSDWLVPTTELLRGRGVPGEGIIPLARFLASVARVGYQGPIEIEVLNDRFAAMSPFVAALELKNALAGLLAPSNALPLSA